MQRGGASVKTALAYTFNDRQLDVTDSSADVRVFFYLLSARSYGKLYGRAFLRTGENRFAREL